MDRNKSYNELISLNSYIERFKYLKLDGRVSNETFGTHRYLNQYFYRTKEWKDIRRTVIIRDLGCDMAMNGWEITGLIIIHHINPITLDDVVNRNPILLDLNNLVCVSKNTHNAIHYGDESLLVVEPITRVQNDTCPWKK